MTRISQIFWILWETTLFCTQILFPTRITGESKTLIDNIFLSPTKLSKISGNITSGISDHLQQFLLLNISFQQPSSEYFKRDWKNFDRENFILDFISTDWDQILDLKSKEGLKYFT